MSENNDRTSSIPRSQCPGISYTDMLDLDTGTVPDVLREESQQDLGVSPIPTERYTSQEFAQLENEKLWPKVWQFAAREEEMPSVGDSVVYENAGRSYVLIRQQDMSVRAFHNVCLHRGRKLRTQPGNVSSLKCPFHGFTWNNDGTLKEIPCAWDFEHLKPDEMQLPELKVDRWQGYIMVSENRAIAPFAEWIGPVAKHFERWRLDECSTVMWIARVMPANWKAVAEAFMEAFHSVTTHPQILPFLGDANSRYDLYGDYVNRAITPASVLSPHIADDHDQDYILQKAGQYSGRLGVGDGGEADDVFKGISDDDPVKARKVSARLKRAAFQEGDGYDYSDVCDSEMIDMFTYNVFPNFSPWGGFVPNLVYRWTTGANPNECMMEIRVLKRAPKGEPLPKSVPMHLIADDQPFASAADMMGKDLAAVFDQDLSNLKYVQEGMDASKTGALQLGHYQESRIRHFQNTLMKYINA